MNTLQPDSLSHFSRRVEVESGGNSAKLTIYRFFPSVVTSQCALTIFLPIYWKHFPTIEALARLLVRVAWVWLSLGQPHVSRAPLHVVGYGFMNFSSTRKQIFKTLKMELLGKTTLRVKTSFDRLRVHMRLGSFQLVTLCVRHLFMQLYVLKR